MKKLLFLLLAAISIQANAGINRELATICNWKLETIDKNNVSSFVSNVRLQQSGKVTGGDKWTVNDNIYSWTIEDGNVSIIDTEGFVAVHLNELSLNSLGQVVLKGAAKFSPRTSLALTCMPTVAAR
jgi:lipopolysaccharide export system protein LptA